MLHIQKIGLITLIRKEMKRVFRIWPQTLLPPVVTMTLYFLIFGRFIGSRIGDIDGFTYIEFIVPVLIMMSVITTSYSNVVSTVFSSKWQRSIEELLVSPMRSATILLGFLSGGIIRGMLVGCLVTCVSMVFTPLSFNSFSLTVVTIILTSLLFSLMGFLNALFAKSFDDISIVPTFVLTSLTYLGGVFYSISSLPSFWQDVSLFNPILYLVNVFRFGFLGISDIPVLWALLALACFVVAFWVIAHRLLNRGYGIKN